MFVFSCVGFVCGVVVGVCVLVLVGFGFLF